MWLLLKSRIRFRKISWKRALPSNLSMNYTSVRWDDRNRHGRCQRSIPADQRTILSAQEGDWTLIFRRSCRPQYFSVFWRACRLVGHWSTAYRCPVRFFQMPEDAGKSGSTFSGEFWRGRLDGVSGTLGFPLERRVSPRCWSLLWAWIGPYCSASWEGVHSPSLFDEKHSPALMCPSLQPPLCFPSRGCRVNGARLDEFLLVTGLALLLETNLRADPCERLHAADASPSGAGQVRCAVTQEAWLALYDLAEEKRRTRAIRLERRRTTEQHARWPRSRCTLFRFVTREGMQTRRLLVLVDSCVGFGAVSKRDRSHEISTSCFENWEFRCLGCAIALELVSVPSLAKPAGKRKLVCFFAKASFDTDRSVGISPAQAGVALLGEHASGQGDGDIEKGESRRLRGIFPLEACSKFWDTVSIATRRGLKVQTTRCAKTWPVGGETDTLTRSVPMQKMSEFSATCVVLPLTAAFIGRGVSPCWPRSAHGRLNKSTLHSPSWDLCGRKLGRLQEEDSKIYSYEAEKNGAADDVRKIAGKNWTTMNWASNDGEVLVLGGEPRHGGGSEAQGAWKAQRTRQDEMTSSDSTTEECSGIFRCREKGRMGEAPKRRNQETWSLWYSQKTRKLILEIRSGGKTVVDWVDGHTKLMTPDFTIAAAQNPLWKWWSRGFDLRRRVADMAVHIFCEHNKEAHIWAVRGVTGREEEWTRTANVVWSEVTGLCGFLGWWLWARRVWNWDIGSGLHANFGVGHNLHKVRAGAWSKFPRHPKWEVVPCWWVIGFSRSTNVWVNARFWVFFSEECLARRWFVSHVCFFGLWVACGSGVRSLAE